MQIFDLEVCEVYRFKYLESLVHKKYGLQDDMKIKTGWTLVGWSGRKHQVFRLT